MRKHSGYLGVLACVFLIISACSITTSGKITVSAMNKVEIEKYLNEMVMNPNFDGIVFCAFEILESDASAGEIYLWALMEEYYHEGSLVQLGSGMSVPIVLKVSTEQQSFKIQEHYIPGDGSYYADDVRRLFPRNVHTKIFEYSSKHISKLIDEVETKVKAAF
ncbi:MULTISPECIES: hypothetical protein [Bacillus]|uniref:hypothetical protein n=1 Tax=Bacillus TaxID=1386 RepID=UPI000BB6AE76|nr:MULTISPECIES: hypothetical protein [Bacillus]